MRTGRLHVPARAVIVREAAFHRHRLTAGRLLVDLDTPQARQHVGDLSVHHMAAVQLGGDGDGQAQLLPGLLHRTHLGRRADEVAAQRHERLDLARDHLLAGRDGGGPLMPRRLETVHVLEHVQRGQFRLFGDPHRALALHVGVAPNRTDSGARLADVAAQQQQVDHHLHVLNPRHMLGQAHAVDAHAAVGLGVVARHALQRRARQPRHPLDLGPVRRAAVVGERLEAVGVFPDEVVVQHLAVLLVRRRRLDREAAVVLRLRQQGLAIGGVRLAPSRLGVVHGDQRLADAGQGRNVAADPHLVDLRGDLRLAQGQHLLGVLRIGEALQPPFAQGVEADDAGPAIHRILQLVQDARRGRARIVGDVEHQVGLLEVLQRHRADGHPDALGQGHRGRFVAHVGAVGQVVGPVHARHQLPHVAGLKRRPAADVEDGLVGIAAQRPQLAPDLLEGAFPRDLFVLVGFGVPPHRVGQPPRLLQIVVEPGLKLRQGVLVEEGLVGAVLGGLPGGGLDAVLAHLQRVRLGRFAPGAGHAHVAVVLVLTQHRLRTADRQLLAHQDLGDRFRRAVAAGRALVSLDGGCLAGCGHAAGLLRGSG